jgi:2-polyprenyl-3-methyl-5-hydroxy-6-metoxy-1,4-benzoquinol methylase
VDERYAEAYGSIARAHWWWQAREFAIVRQVRKLRRGLPPGRILDVGCGDGILFPALAEFGEVEGIEADASTLSPSGPWRGRIHIAPFDEAAPLHGPYDLILMLDVIEHLDDPVSALRRACALLGPKGAVLVTVPALPWLWTSHDDLNHHRRRYTRTQLNGEFSAAGLEAGVMRFVFHSLVVAKLAVRFRERLHRRPAQVPLVPPRAVNALARLLTKVEVVLLAPVSRVVPGTSLLAVGHPVDRQVQ